MREQVLVGGFFSVLALTVLYMIVRCKHPWELVDKTEFPSAIEQMAKTGMTQAAYYPSDLYRLTRRSVVLALRCPKCGKATIKKIDQ